MAGFDPTDFNRWLRQRRAIRASRAGKSDYRRDDFYDDYGGRIDHDPDKYRVALRRIKIGIGAAAVVVVVVVVSLVRSGGSDDPEIITTTTAAVTTTSTLATTTTTVAAVDLPVTLAGLRDQLTIDLMLSLIDARGDIVDSISLRTPGYSGGDIDISGLSVYRAMLDDAGVRSLFTNTSFPCGSTDPFVVCSVDPLPMPVGDYLIVAVDHAESVPTDAPERSYIYSVVFDSDGDPANDWVFNPPFDWDFFIGTDRWYQAVYSHATGSWQINAVQVSTDGTAQATQTAARAVIDEGWVIWFIPANEFPLFPPPMRATAFGHDGSFGEATRGGDVTGANPTEPLVVPDSSP